MMFFVFCLSGCCVDELCKVVFMCYYMKYVEGFVLVEFGDIKVFCIVSVVECVFEFLCECG